MTIPAITSATAMSHRTKYMNRQYPHRGTQRILLYLLAAGAALAACGGDDDDDEGDPEPSGIVVAVDFESGYAEYTPKYKLQVEDAAGDRFWVHVPESSWNDCQIGDSFSGRTLRCGEP
jgi:hypothetical protein